MAERNPRRTALRKARVEAGRIEAFVSDYVKQKDITLYNEAKQMFDLLRGRYPNKLNLKKTREYQAWKDHGAMDLKHTGPFQKQPVHGFKDTLQLHIPLINITEGQTTAGERVTVEEQATAGERVTVEEQATVGEQATGEEISWEDTIIPALNVPLSDGLIAEVIKDLQADPSTRDILLSIEEQEEFNLLGMDIDFEDGNLLEREILNW